MSSVLVFRQKKSQEALPTLRFFRLKNLEPGTSELPYYCKPPVCVPTVLGALAVWRQNIKKMIDLGMALLELHWILQVCCVWKKMGDEGKGESGD